VFTLGVLLFRALTGALPWGDQPALLRGDVAAPRPSRLRPGIPPEIDELCERALALERGARPESVLDVALCLRGRTRLGRHELALARCQGCGAALRPAQRLCLACGKQAVLFEHAPDPALGRHAIELVKAQEDADWLARLRETLSAVSAGTLPALNFLVGDQRMYSKEEQARLLRLPLRLFDRLGADTAARLHARMEALDIRTRVVDLDTVHDRQWLAPAILSGAFAVILGGLFVIGVPTFVIVATLGMFAIAAIVVWAVRRRRSRKHDPDALLRLRPAPAALPASDPLVERLARLLREPTAADVKERVGELALLVQRLVDHRLEHARERAEIDAVTAPVVRLVELVERQVGRLREIDRDLAALDEGAIVRALGASEARREPRSARDELLGGLDRLRALEDERARGFHRLLEASRLLRRAVELGLAVRDDQLAHEREVALALRSLETE
jgi:hypothetical protein